MHLLQEGRLQEAVSLLESLRQASPDDTDVLYNLGMALSDLGQSERSQLDIAVQRLTRLTTLDPARAHGWVALGVAQQRRGETAAAIDAQRRALELDPDNGYACRNLGAMLGKAGDIAGALIHLRRAAELLPDDPMSLFGLAQLLEKTGEAADTTKADTLYIQIIRIAGDSQIGELARRARSRLAQDSLRENAGGAPSMASVMYCLSALERFARLTPPEVQAIVMEIALLGQRGLDTNDPTSKYRLRAVSDELFTGLQLVSMMYVGLKQIAPHADMGFDLSTEYQTALQMFDATSPKGSSNSPGSRN